MRVLTQRTDATSDASTAQVARLSPVWPTLHCPSLRTTMFLPRT